MSLANAWNPLLYTFYFLGQSPFPSTSIDSKSYFKRLLLKLPALIIICVSVYATVHFFNNDFYIAWEERGLDVIQVLLILSSLITNLVVAYRCLFRGLLCIHLQQSFSALEIEVQSSLPSRTLHLMKFRNVFLMKCVTMVILYAALVFAMVMSRVKKEYSTTSLMIVLAFNIDFCALQVVLYVDLIKFFLKATTDTFRDINSDKAKCDKEAFAKTELLTSIRKLYSSIYKIVGKVNEHFGLILLTYIVQQFLVIAYYVFWILLNKFKMGIWTSMDNTFVLACATISLFFVSDSCHQVCVEAQKIGSFLCENDYLIREEGQRLLTQTINQPMQITAMEFYKLDRSFFAAVTVGGITTAIMLVQFQDY
ncbi:uncharacterized protein LOC119066400 [Bradysia coprophila]|uniref:uncharacterized protein LOC119066400 n=1 Tax=Bradysia coprophila TaxID=38358 RepID=UPI00187D7555|nr:uncharacterized protein LOC119066400 [Bradysia coprophila]